MTITELKKARAAKVEDAEKLTKAADAEERDLTDAECDKIDALLNESDEMQKKIEAAEAREAREARLAKASSSLDRRPGRVSTPDALEVPDGADISAGKDRREDDLTCGFKTYGDFCNVVRTHSRPAYSGQTDERIDFMAAAYGQNESSGEDGGFLVPPEYSNRIVERAITNDDLLGRCDRVIMARNIVKLNGTVDHDRSSTTYRHGGVIVYWVDEAGQFTRSSLKFRKIELSLNKIGALSFCTDEELGDAIVNFGDRLFNKHAEAIREELTEAVLWGNGAGRPLGALNNDACVAVSRGTANSWLYADVISMEEALYVGSEGKAIWLFNPELWGQVRSFKLASGTGNDPSMIIDVKGKSIDGRSYVKTDHCEALGTAGDAALVDLSQYLLATKGSIKTAMSIHLRFDYGETAFRSSFRVDGKPAWDRTLTPRKGSQTVSPFVKLS